ncbi:helix-turn-helix domain-containing protein [Nocardioides sp.]|uniref:TetR/AcrR family transcriptional regulator n=1 Tax=Nocardioides sp. TaxID=35761 RepID=UPI001A20B191|nr:helix-turn-helix domain-containing protein [Nocardioides sp.]MBJ7357479.1 helix-turn-helix transcriptional regulator [Nocardioides sp.]
MTDRPLLPLLDDRPRERSDAARNRAALLRAAQEIAESCGYDAVTMDAVAAKAGVGKGTVFRRFQSREGLMGALLDASESEWQASVMTGPPPLGPGAPPMDRLLAFGRSRLDIVLQHADLIRNAGFGGAVRSYAAYSFTATHVRYLLGELGVQGDIAMLAVALMAPLELPILDQQVHIERIDVDRVYAGWVDLARRITRPA